MQWIHWYDWLLLPLYYLILRLLFFRFAAKRYTGRTLRNFRFGFNLKMLGALGFVVYHAFVYGGGDTFLYFDTAQRLLSDATVDPARFFTSLFAFSQENPDLRFETLDEVVFGNANFFVVRIAAFFSVFAFNAFIPLTLIFSALSFIGIWYAYRSLCRMYPPMEKFLAVSFLFIPSVILWGSGLGKDSIAFGGICLAFGAALRLFLLPDQKKLKNVIYLLLGAYPVLILKSYILLSFVLAFFVGLVLQKIKQLKPGPKKVFLVPLLLVVCAAAVAAAVQYANNDPDFGLDLIAHRVTQNSMDLGAGSSAGSAYDIGLSVTYYPTFADIVPLMPKAIFITLFRPFLWEVSNPAMLLSALESFGFLAAFLIVLFRRKMIGIIPRLFQEPIALSCLIFVLVFAAFVGISSGNFGTLVRYKIPCLPFLGTMLALCYSNKNSYRSSSS